MDLGCLVITSRLISGYELGSIPRTPTKMKKKYLHKLVQIKYDGKPEIGFVIEETRNYDGIIEVRVLLQKTKQRLYFSTAFTKPKLLEE